MCVVLSHQVGVISLSSNRKLECVFVSHGYILGKNPYLYVFQLLEAVHILAYGPGSLQYLFLLSHLLSLMLIRRPAYRDSGDDIVQDNLPISKFLA